MGGETPLSSSILAHFCFVLLFEIRNDLTCQIWLLCHLFVFVHHLGGIAPLWIWLETAELIFPDDDEGENTGWDY
jgi:hypothetical protein